MDEARHDIRTLVAMALGFYAAALIAWMVVERVPKGKTGGG